LIEIRDSELYKSVKVRGDNGFQKSKWTTFEEYIEDRWEFKRSHGYRLLDAADLTQKIAFYQSESLTGKDEKCPQIGDVLPEYESHIRPLLTGLKTDSERITVWQNAVYDSKGNQVKITAFNLLSPVTG
jgi:hypothetical protein